MFRNPNPPPIPHPHPQRTSIMEYLSIVEYFCCFVSTVDSPPTLNINDMKIQLVEERLLGHTRTRLVCTFERTLGLIPVLFEGARLLRRSGVLPRSFHIE